MQRASDRAALLPHRSVHVQTFQRGGRDYDHAKDVVLAVVRKRPGLLRKTVPARYVKKLFLEEEDPVDYICLLRFDRKTSLAASSSHRDSKIDADSYAGFMLLTRKALTSWVPPGWKWRYLDDAEAKRLNKETEYMHTASGRVVYDDLDEVWKGHERDEKRAFRVNSVHILLISAEKGKGHLLIDEAKRLARDHGLDAVSLGAASDELQHMYAERYGFVDDRVGCARRSAESRKFLREWHRAHLESEGLYGHFMSKCLR